jgi:hypothetical protein
MLDHHRGTPRARSWPKKRGRRLAQKTKDQMEWFRQAQWATKFWDPWIFQTYQQAVKGTPLLPRDICTMQMAGRLAFVVFDDGTPCWSKEMRLDVSYSLDVITHLPGSILARGINDWLGIEAGDAGYVLTSVGPGEVPQWMPGGGDAGYPTWLWVFQQTPSPFSPTATTTATLGGGSLTSACQNAQTGNYWYWTAGQSGRVVTIDLSVDRIVTGIMTMQSTVGTSGIWQAQISTDGVNWVNVGSPAQWGGATRSVWQWSSSTAVRYIRLVQQSGTTEGTSWQTGFMLRYGSA